MSIPLPPPNLAPGVLGSIAPERLQRFRRAVTRGSHSETLRLYLIDTELSAQCYGLFRTVEVLLREAIHRGLSAEFGTVWFRDAGLRAVLEPRTIQVLDEADQVASTRRRPATAGAVVQQIMLGTWVKLLARGPRGRYEAGIWSRALAARFQEDAAAGAPHSRAQVYELAQHLLWARNRVGHCQPVVFGFPLVGQLTSGILDGVRLGNQAALAQAARAARIASERDRIVRRRPVRPGGARRAAPGGGVDDA